MSCVGRVAGAIALGRSPPGVAISSLGTRTACVSQESSFSQPPPGREGGRASVRRLSELEEARGADDPRDSRPGRVHRRVPARSHRCSGLWDCHTRGQHLCLGPAPGEERGAVGMPCVPWTSLSLTLSASSLSALKALSKPESRRHSQPSPFLSPA